MWRLLTGGVVWGFPNIRCCCCWRWPLSPFFGCLVGQSLRASPSGCCGHWVRFVPVREWLPYWMPRGGLWLSLAGSSCGCLRRTRSRWPNRCVRGVRSGRSRRHVRNLSAQLWSIGCGFKGSTRAIGMDVQRERRIGVDRREYAICYRYGSERRENTERRGIQIGESEMPTANRVISLGDVARLLWSARR